MTSCQSRLPLPHSQLRVTNSAPRSSQTSQDAQRKEEEDDESSGCELPHFGQSLASGRSSLSQQMLVVRMMYPVGITATPLEVQSNAYFPGVGEPKNYYPLLLYFPPTYYSLFIRCGRLCWRRIERTFVDILKKGQSEKFTFLPTDIK
uniref:Uncharacterized protein n=1 Tax=Trichobilharzia regenti TaxID=157069 RepID=A0AA85JS81_TRIRE|nr:unnamed protein product [Trichobilharzia regenti]